MKRECTKCGRLLELDEYHFYKDKNSKNGFAACCKECRGFNFTVRQTNSDKTVDGHKPCHICNRLLPATLEYFYKNSELTDGLFGKCKECMGGKFGIRPTGIKAYNGNGEKKCSACGNWYPATDEYFFNKSYRKDGLDCQCKQCVKKYNESIKDLIIERSHIRYLNNKEHILEVSGAWKKNNPEKVKEINKRSREKPGNKINKCRLQQKRKALKAELPATFTAEQWIFCLEYFNNRCAYCGQEDDKLTQDHVIPLSKGGEYTVNNIVPACLSCNSKKNNKDLLTWYTIELNFYSETRNKKLLKYLHSDGKKQQMALEF